MPRLRIIPVDDPRPTLDSDEVIARAVIQVIEDLIPWVQRWTKSPIAVDKVAAIVALAVKASKGDGFSVAVYLKTEEGWPVDMQACRMFDRICSAIPYALRTVTREWVVRSGMRFPAKAGDVIDWWIDGRERRGSVYSILGDESAALIYPQTGLGTGNLVKVLAEDVVDNITTRAVRLQGRG